MPLRLANAIPRQKVVVSLSQFDQAIIAPLLVGVILLIMDHWLDGRK
ncbi:type I toxin-antitoxin system Fst family toxin [Lacticaseibacillus suihuaensis]